MKNHFKLLASVFLFVASANDAGAVATDLTCMNACVAHGLGIDFCRGRCSYNDNFKSTDPTIRTDLTCINNCLTHGYARGLCQQECSTRK